MSEERSLEENVIGNSPENVEGEVPEIHTLTREAVNKQIKGFIALLTRQLKKLTRLVQGRLTTPHPSHYPRTDFSTISGTAARQSDMVTGATVTRIRSQPMTHTETNDKTPFS